MAKCLLPLIMVLLFIQGCATEQPVKRIAVMDFENATGTPESKGLSVAVSEWLTNMFANGDRIYVVDRQDMNRMIGAHYRGDLQHLKYERWQEIGDRLAVDYFISGGVSRLDQNYIIDGRLFSVATGQIVPGTAREVSVSRIQDLYPATQSLSRFLLYQIQRRQAPLPASGASAPRTPQSTPGSYAGSTNLQRQSSAQSMMPAPAPVRYSPQPLALGQ